MNGLEESTTPTRSHVRVVIMVVPHTACAVRRAAAVGAWGKYPRCESGGGHGAAHTALSIKKLQFNIIQGICNLPGGRNNYTT
jgi:hypothetical protein